MLEEDWVIAGRIIARVAKKIQGIVKPGKTLLEIAEEIEREIKKQGAELAFPVNLSMNEIAAHYTPSPLDKTKLETNSLIKIDMGANVNGALSDMAITIVFGTLSKKVRELIKATQDALYKAIDMIKDGVRVIEVSKQIWKTAHEYGFGVLVDLGGHNLKRWILHGGITIPNAPSRDFINRRKLRKGMVVAIEPFLVNNSKDSETEALPYEQIFSIIPSTKIKESKFLEFIWRRYRTLPFALRWLAKKESTFTKVEKLVKYYLNQGHIVGYPALKDVKGNLVVQFEHTVYVKDNSAEILTVV